MGLSNHPCYKVSLSLTGHSLPCSVVKASHVFWVSNGQLTAVHSPRHTSTLISRLGHTLLNIMPRLWGTLGPCLRPSLHPDPPCQHFYCAHTTKPRGRHRCSTRRSRREHGVTPLNSGVPCICQGIQEISQGSSRTAETGHKTHTESEIIFPLLSLCQLLLLLTLQGLLCLCGENVLFIKHSFMVQRLILDLWRGRKKKQFWNFLENYLFSFLKPCFYDFYLDRDVTMLKAEL